MTIFGKYNGNKVTLSPRVKHNGVVKTPVSGWTKRNGELECIYRGQIGVKSIIFHTSLDGIYEGGGTVDLTDYVTISPDNATDKTLTWTIEWVSGDRIINGEETVSITDSGILTIANVNAGSVEFKVIATASNGITGYATANLYIAFGISTGGGVG